MNRHLLAVFALILTFNVSAFAQEGKQSIEEPKTKIEKFIAKDGTVIIKSYKNVGTLQGTYGSSAEFDVMEFINTVNGTKEYGIRIELKEGGRIEKERAVYIDSDEISSLIRGIDYIQGFKSSSAEYPYFEAIYRTRGDFNISVFNDKSNNRNLCLDSGRIYRVTVFLNIGDLSRLREIITKAKESIPEQITTPPKRAIKNKR